MSDEIEGRAERLQREASDSVARGAELVQSIGLHLELTDAVVVWRGHGRVDVIRGGAASFPLYWQPTSEARLRLSTMLPVETAQSLTLTGLRTALTAICLRNCYELNFSADTPLPGWRRVRRGSITSFDEGCMQLERAVKPRSLPEASARGTAAEHVNAALQAFGRVRPQGHLALLELSGGYDSTLAGAAVNGRCRELYGVSVQFPFYEFRSEPQLQADVAAHLGAHHMVVDGLEVMPYAPAVASVRFDEPTVFVSGIRHAEVIGQVAAARGASELYVGHGGDQLFATQLHDHEPFAYSPDRKAFLPEARDSIRSSVDRARSDRWRHRDTGLFVYDATQDVWAKESFGVTVRTPFTDRAMFEAARIWSRHCAIAKRPPDKDILAEACGHMLPASVRDRDGKVAYNGVWSRAYRHHGEHIANTLIQCRHILSRVGMSLRWLLDRVEALAEWKTERDREVLAAYALCCWLLDWDLPSRAHLEP